MKTDDIASAADFFKVLSDPTRLRLFQILLTGVQCNCELGKVMGISANLISHHIHILMEAGLVVSKRSDRDARWIYYSVNEESLARIRRSIDPFFTLSEIPVREPACPAINLPEPTNEVMTDE